MSTETPTTDEVRDLYDLARLAQDQQKDGDLEFDRWLAGERAAIWDECVEALAWATENRPDPLRYVAENNPYKGQEGNHYYVP